MTSLNDFCEMLLLIAHDVRLSERPYKLRRNQFLQLVYKDFDKDWPYDVRRVRHEFESLSQILHFLAQQPDPLPIVWKLGKEVPLTARMTGKKFAVMNSLDYINFKRTRLHRGHHLRGMRLKLVAGKPPS